MWLAARTAGPDRGGVARAVGWDRHPGLKEPGGTSASTTGAEAQKKSLHAAERDTEANLKRREEFLATVAAIPPEKLIFLDESGVTTTMTRMWGRAPRGERICEATPQGRWEVLTTLGAMSLRGIDAAMTIESATDGEVFKGYVKQVLCPKLRPGDVVILDNLSAHKVPGTSELVEACGAQLLYPAHRIRAGAQWKIPCGWPGGISRGGW